MKKIIGLDLGGTFIKVGLVDRKGSILKRRQIPTDAEKGREKILSQMKKAISLFFEEKNISGIGIGTPGLVDKKGRVFSPPNLPDLHNTPLKDIFEKEFSLPVVVENDVNTLTWGEFIFGAGKGYKNIVCITLGTGLGGGVVVEGRLLKGKYSAVELGHISINYKGPRCKCGGIGCIERYVGAEYIIQRARRKLKNKKSKISQLVKGDLNKITPKIIYQAAKMGDRLAKEVWEETGFYIGVMLANIVNIFNPEAIIIGGGISQAAEFLFPSIEKIIKERAFPLLSKDVVILPTKLGSYSGILAAASLLL